MNALGTNVVVADDGPPNDAADDVHWRYVAEQLRAKGISPDVVLSSVTYGPGFAAHLGAVHVSIDDDRDLLPISGSLIRSDLHGHRDDMDPRVYRHFVERVVFLERRRHPPQS